MTFLGWNYDLFFGITAVLFLIYSRPNPKILTSTLFKLWNILGICSLFEVVIIGILSSPLPLQSLAFDHPNIAVLQFPFVLLPTIVVPIVILSHFHLLGNRTAIENRQRSFPNANFKPSFHRFSCKLNTVPAGSVIQCMFSGSSSISSQVSTPFVCRYLVASSTFATVSCNHVSECV